MVRAPLLPTEFYLSLAADYLEVWQRKAASDGASPSGSTDRKFFAARIRQALAVGSLSLLDALERAHLDKPASVRRAEKLLRYLIRMSTRPTPFGLFAGVALACWDTQTDLTIASASAHSRMRPDMEWLARLVFALESRPDVRSHLRLVTNSMAFIHAGQVYLAQRAPGQAPKGVLPEDGVSLRATGVVRRALALARRPIGYAELTATLLAETSSATPELVEQLVAQLCDQTLLLTDLRPPLTTADPAHYVAQRLADVPCASAVATELDTVLREVAAWDELPPVEVIASYRQIVTRTKAMVEVETETPIEVDMALSLVGTHVSRLVGVEVARATDLLLRMSPVAHGSPVLRAYREAFVGRYGVDREVPLLELLHPEFGLGPLPDHGHPADHASTLDQTRQNERNQTLLELAYGAMRNRERAVDLDSATIARLETWVPNNDRLPPSLELYVLVGARSAAALDAGEFEAVVAPAIGSMAAGRSFGRFADLLGDTAAAALDQAARVEEQRAPQRIWAELVYPPSPLRLANVVVRPAVRQYELAVAASAGVDADRTISLDELVVGIRDSRFYLRWPMKGVDVQVCYGHMLNYVTTAPAVARFLAELPFDDIALLSAFDWGPAANSPFLPRVTVGRIVLSPARWYLNAQSKMLAGAVNEPDTFSNALRRWRDQWDVPRYIYMRVADNRLLLDLDLPWQADLLRTELLGMDGGNPVIIEEVVPDLSHMWVHGPDGHYATEFVVPLILKNAARPEARDKGPVGANRARISARQGAAPHLSRLRPPGSDWLFVKLYCGQTLQDNMIAWTVRLFADDALAAHWADDWFFVRFADPDPHVRLRFHGTPEQLKAQLLPPLCEWAGQLVEDARCSRFTIDTYDREIERYGGEEGLEIAESVFGADSRAVAELLRLIEGEQVQIERPLLAALTVDDLLDGLKVGENGRLDWYRGNTPSRHEAGAEYRQHKVLLRGLLSRPMEVQDHPIGDLIAPVLAARRATLARASERLATLAHQGMLSQGFDDLYRSYVHMHCNRLLGIDSEKERTVVGLLLRTRDGLIRSPQRNSDSQPRP